MSAPQNLGVLRGALEAVRRVEGESSLVTDAEGNRVALLLPMDAWRSIRAALMRTSPAPPDAS